MPYEISKMYDFKYKIIYFALEEPKEQFIDELILQQLNVKYNINIDRLTLNSMYEKSLSKDILDKIDTVTNEVEAILEHVDIVDTIKNPTGIYNYIKDYSNKIGTHHYKTISINGVDTKVYSHYEQNDDTFVLIVVDHVSLLSPERDGMTKQKLSLHETMSKWSTEYCLGQITKHMKFSVINVQQLGMSSDDVNHFKANKLEPSIDKAANNKEILRDCHLILSLFAPDRYELAVHDKYSITKLKDRYRSMKVLKFRFGRSNIKVPLLFQGAIGKFSELDLPNKINYETIYKI